MANPQDDLEKLHAVIAEIAARVYRLEQRAGVISQPETPSPSQSAATGPTPEVSLSAVSSEAPQWQGSTFAAQPNRQADELEGTIGKLWLNRIGIFAILVGVSYFIKYAFDNGWIGPSGKITLGLLA